MIRPPPLEPGDLIGVFTPSFPAHVRFREKYLHGLDQLRAMGFAVKEGPLTARQVHQGYRSGTPRERAEEVMALVRDPGVKALIATIGGANSSSLIPYLDFGAIRAHPKIICGYSDLTALHLAVLAFSGLSSFYGPAVMPSFGEWPEVMPETRASFLDAVQRHRSGSRPLEAPPRWSNHFRDAATDAWQTEPRTWNPNPGWTVLQPGTVSAPAIVANLNTLVSQAGTATFPDLEGKILVIEEMRAPWDLQERSLRHLERLGVLDEICGLVVGKPEFPDPQGAPFGYDALISEVVGPRHFPIVMDFDCGHTHPMLTLAQMTPLTIEAETGGAVTIRVDAPMVTRA